VRRLAVALDLSFRETINRGRRLNVTPDGATRASGGVDGTVKLWDGGGRQRGAFVWRQREVTSLALAQDGMTAASGVAVQSVVVWDIDSPG